MKLIFCVAIALLLSNFLQAQNDTNKELGSSFFRVSATIPMGLSLLASYEQEIKNPFRVVFKTGPFIDFVASGGATDGKIAFSIHSFGAIEPRYYFNIKQRIKKQKTVKNYSATYLSIEPFVLSNRLIVSYSRIKSEGGSYGAFFNIGFQCQKARNWYYAGYAGATPFNKSTGKPFTSSTDKVHIGFTIGYTF